MHIRLLICLCALGMLVILLAQRSIWRSGSTLSPESIPRAAALTLDSLRPGWPLDRDTGSPQFFVNATPLFRAQYLHARRSIKPHLHGRREIILREMIRDELLRQRALTLDGLSEVELKEISRVPAKDETWSAYRGRRYYAHTSLSRSLRSVYALDQTSQRALNQEIRGADVTEGTHHISYRGYHLSLTDLKPAARHLAVSRLKTLARRLKTKRIRWSDLGRSMVESAHLVSTERVRIGSADIPTALRTHLTRADQLIAGQVLPLIITQDEAWWVRITHISRTQPDHPPVQARHDALRDTRHEVRRELEELLTQIYQEASLEVSIDDVNSATLERLKTRDAHLIDESGRVSFILSSPSTSLHPQL